LRDVTFEKTQLVIPGIAFGLSELGHLRTKPCRVVISATGETSLEEEFSNAAHRVSDFSDQKVVGLSSTKRCASLQRRPLGLTGREHCRCVVGSSPSLRILGALTKAKLKNKRVTGEDALDLSFHKSHDEVETVGNEEEESRTVDELNQLLSWKETEWQVERGGVGCGQGFEGLVLTSGRSGVIAAAKCNLKNVNAVSQG
ncbi:hypothetical protein KCU61_g778, partial [Aureobasidium melanogenum]